MLIWVASFPRSGNTFLRIVLHRLYAVETSVVYDFDGVADRLGSALLGARERPGTLDELRASDGVHLVKTHRPRGADAHDDDPAVCLVRDGRDALVSWARLEAERTGRDFLVELRSMIEEAGSRGAGGWGENVLSWLRPPAPHRVVLRYEELIRDPAAAAARVIGALGLPLRPVPGATIPSFAELHATDPGFFRRGHTGTHRDELPAELHRAFWSDPDNAAAMELLSRRTVHTATGMA